MSFEISVSSTTNAKQLAASVRERYRDRDDADVKLVAIGAQAVNCALKGVVEANKLLAASGTYCTVVPVMEDRVVVDRETPGHQVTRTVFVLRLVRHTYGGMT